jgi:predicted metal-dependent hydrolase
MPAYRVRISSRARRVLLRVTPGKGLEVVIPEGFDEREIPGILLRHQGWIARQLNRFPPDQPRSEADFPLPGLLDLRAIGLRVGISYGPRSDGVFQLVMKSRQEIEIQGKSEDRSSIFRLLREWLKFQARPPLARMLAQLSTDTGLRYESFQIRGQKRRWGSYSSRGTISLNWKLLFLPPELVRYLVIHELCHSVHLNHSAAFWKLVERHEPDCRTLDGRLRKAKDFVPPWADEK